MSILNTKREQSRQLLLQIGFRLFSEKGYEATSIRMIAKEAGVSLGLLYNYFQSKEELLKAIFESSQADIAATFEEAEGYAKGIPGIERHIRNMVKLLKEKQEFWRLLHSLRMQRKFVSDMMGSINQQVNYIHHMIEKNLNEVGYTNPSQEALLLFATLDGMASHYLLDTSYPIDELATNLIQKYKTNSNND
ncbi:TetR/AcrR family transcriptional regulator [Pontibacter sp. H249]|uniref:TetR/AcrR family transcriptional regulator n=1 Tax=Pontibacter sp. H249 TaxID=3133420 RepID=UPI0030BFC41C